MRHVTLLAALLAAVVGAAPALAQSQDPAAVLRRDQRKAAEGRRDLNQSQERAAEDRKASRADRERLSHEEAVARRDQRLGRTGAVAKERAAIDQDQRNLRREQRAEASGRATVSRERFRSGRDAADVRRDERR